MATEYKFTATSRIPSRPLSYENKSLAKPKEVVIDYTNGLIYICDINGNLIDVTKELLKEVDRVVHDSLVSEDFNQTVKNITITLPDGNQVTIENAIINAFSKIDEINDTIINNYNSLTNKIDGLKENIPTASEIIPIASEDTGKVGSAVKVFALADHVHPKGKASSADSATKATQDASGNVITSTYATKNELRSNYLPLAGGTITGNLTVNGTSTLAKLALTSTNYGTGAPSGSGVVGQIYLQLI